MMPVDSDSTAVTSVKLSGQSAPCHSHHSRRSILSSNILTVTKILCYCRGLSVVTSTKKQDYTMRCFESIEIGEIKSELNYLRLFEQAQAQAQKVHMQGIGMGKPRM